MMNLDSFEAFAAEDAHYIREARFSWLPTRTNDQGWIWWRPYFCWYLMGDDLRLAYLFCSVGSQLSERCTEH